jgi:hypothetical protein
LLRASSEKKTWRHWVGNSKLFRPSGRVDWKLPRANPYLSFTTFGFGPSKAAGI